MHVLLHEWGPAAAATSIWPCLIHYLLGRVFWGRPQSHVHAATSTQYPKVSPTASNQRMDRFSVLDRVRSRPIGLSLSLCCTRNVTQKVGGLCVCSIRSRLTAAAGRASRRSTPSSRSPSAPAAASRLQRTPQQGRPRLRSSYHRQDNGSSVRTAAGETKERRSRMLRRTPVDLSAAVDCNARLQLQEAVPDAGRGTLYCSVAARSGRQQRPHWGYFEESRV